MGSRNRCPGLSLLEVLFASVILVLAIVPTIGLMTSSSHEVVKVRERLIASHAAMAIVEDLRSRRQADRSDVPPTSPAGLAKLVPLLNAFRAENAAAAAEIDRLLSGFSCSATIGGTAPAQTAHVEVTWTEAGRPMVHSVDARLDLP